MVRIANLPWLPGKSPKAADPSAADKMGSPATSTLHIGGAGRKTLGLWDKRPSTNAATITRIVALSPGFTAFVMSTAPHGQAS
jgi:hypothetical protein